MCVMKMTPMVWNGWEIRQVSKVEFNSTTSYVFQAPLTVADEKPDDSWPYHGAVTFQEYSMRYREELDLVVRNICAEIKGGEKVW